MLELSRSNGYYPPGLKPGDFIQTTSHCGDVFFEVLSCIQPSQPGDYWHITYVTYDKYGSQPGREFVNSAGSIRAVIPAEMAIPVMVRKRLRFKSKEGQFDPFYGYAPVGTPLRKKEVW
ncbi:fuculose phosphate aldolase [Novimethylophilus kurashikiensis]|uniref:Fuculose phosphate aldolase n=1 Tax=Novimethylophilus kurashikiensis TaxID=1825523 RepID=A0A2R5F9U5_9PROT|nr:hypothetical protein [Novimethylophilus kurashikiensis]GBG14318.1 fuculose phosphate aldolase [Novimethylophilus kurashikiensis]